VKLLQPSVIKRHSCQLATFYCFILIVIQQHVHFLVIIGDVLYLLVYRLYQPVKTPYAPCRQKEQRKQCCPCHWWGIEAWEKNLVISDVKGICNRKRNFIWTFWSCTCSIAYVRVSVAKLALLLGQRTSLPLQVVWFFCVLGLCTDLS